MGIIFHKTKRIVPLLLALSILMAHSTTTAYALNAKKPDSFNFLSSFFENKSEESIKETIKISFCDVASQCHKVLSDNDFSYGTHSYVFSKETPKTTKTKTIDCSGYVTWVLYEYGKKTGNNTFKDLFSTSLSASMLKDIFASYTKYFEYVGKADKVEMKEGDLLVRPGKHIEIFSHISGTGNWKIKCWHAGNTSAIRAESTSSGVVNSSPSLYYVYRIK